ncbi:MAG: hypothetical protein ACK2T3_17270, partial [Candidatus Promineifilaceae bacterium]
DALFNEPGGLSVGDGNLYIADTNNHVIRVADLSNGEVSTLVLIDPEGLLTRLIPGLEYTGKVVQLEPEQLASGPGAVVLNVGLPEGYKVNDLAPFSMEWSADGGIASFSDADAKQQITDPDFPISVPVNFSPGDGVLTGDLIIYFCESEAQSLCFIDRVQINIPLNVSETGVNELDVAYTIPQPEE